MVCGGFDGPKEGDSMKEADVKSFRGDLRTKPFEELTISLQNPSTGARLLGSPRNDSGSIQFWVRGRGES
jgi:hypothetical protein